MSTIEKELKRTAEQLVEISEQQGAYFAAAFLYDSSYDFEMMKKLLPVLQNTDGAIKNEYYHGAILNPNTGAEESPETTKYRVKAEILEQALNGLLFIINEDKDGDFFICEEGREQIEECWELLRHSA